MTTFLKHSVLVLLVLAVGCAQEPPEDLGGGYSLLPTNAENRYIIRGNEFVVDTNIVEYDVKNNYVFGLREPSRHPDVDEDLISQRYGYFVLNIETGELLEGLDKEAVQSIVGAEID